jgi:hypothetical protein
VLANGDYLKWWFRMFFMFSTFLKIKFKAIFNLKRRYCNYENNLCISDSGDDERFIWLTCWRQPWSCRTWSSTQNLSLNWWDHQKYESCDEEFQISDLSTGCMVGFLWDHGICCKFSDEPVKFLDIFNTINWTWAI